MLHRKILKKHDKMTSTELMGKLMPTVSSMLAKEQRKQALETLKDSVVHEFAIIAHGGTEPEAEQELGRHRRDQLTFERNTGGYWRKGSLEYDAPGGARGGFVLGQVMGA